MMRGSGLYGAIFRGAEKELEVVCSKYSKLEWRNLEENKSSMIMKSMEFDIIQ